MGSKILWNKKGHKMQKSALVWFDFVINDALDAALLWFFNHTESFMSKVFNMFIKEIL